MTQLFKVWSNNKPENIPLGAENSSMRFIALDHWHREKNASSCSQDLEEILYSYWLD